MKARERRKKKKNKEYHLPKTKGDFLGMMSSKEPSREGYCSKILVLIPLCTDDFTWARPERSCGKFHLLRKARRARTKEKKRKGRKRGKEWRRRKGKEEERKEEAREWRKGSRKKEGNW